MTSVVESYGPVTESLTFLDPDEGDFGADTQGTDYEFTDFTLPSQTQTQTLTQDTGHAVLDGISKDDGRRSGNGDGNLDEVVNSVKGLNFEDNEDEEGAEYTRDLPEYACRYEKRCLPVWRALNWCGSLARDPGNFMTSLCKQVGVSQYLRVVVFSVFYCQCSQCSIVSVLLSVFYCQCSIVCSCKTHLCDLAHRQTADRQTDRQQTDRQTQASSSVCKKLYHTIHVVLSSLNSVLSQCCRLHHIKYPPIHIELFCWRSRAFLLEVHVVTAEKPRARIAIS